MMRGRSWFACVVCATILSTPVSAQEANRIVLRVQEPIGVQRDAVPVHTLLNLKRPVNVRTPFRLLRNGKPLAAQFRPHHLPQTTATGPAKSGKTDRFWLDFLARSEPNQVVQYVVEFGDRVVPSPERMRGHKLTVSNDAFVVTHAPYIAWTVPRDLQGLLRSVNFSPAEHLKPDSLGLRLRDRDGRTHQLAGRDVSSRVIRQGRMTVALRFENTDHRPGLADVDWTVDLVFPGPVSWVDVHLKISDPNHRVSAAGLQLNLNLDPPTAARRTLVELGAGRTVYRALTGKGRVELRADARRTDGSWRVLRGHDGVLRPFVVASPQSPVAEGWAHVMDRQRCLAIAFDTFGQAAAERLAIGAAGSVTASKTWPSSRRAAADSKEWRFWLHFVHFPPQQSASTDPYMMRHPLRVDQVSP